MKKVLCVFLAILMSNVLSVASFCTGLPQQHHIEPEIYDEAPKTETSCDTKAEEPTAIVQADEMQEQALLAGTSAIELYYDDWVSEENLREMLGDMSGGTISVPEESKAILEFQKGELHACGVGQADILVGNTVYPINVSKANINIVLVMGQSNAVGVVDTAGATECAKGTSYLWDSKNYNGDNPQHLLQQTGFQSAFAAEWYEQSGRTEKTVVVYEELKTAQRGKAIAYFDDAKLTDIAALFNEAYEYYSDDATHFNLKRGIMVWLQGESDYTRNADDYYSDYVKMVSALNQKTSNRIDNIGIFRVRTNQTDRTNIYYTGSVTAQFNISNNYNNISMISTITEGWYGTENTPITVDTSSYLCVKEPTATTLGVLFDGLHYCRQGYNM